MNLIPNFPDPAPLPESSWLTWLLFEQSGWLAAIAALLGLCSFLILNSRGSSRALRVLGLCLLVGFGFWGLGRWVETTGETLIKRTRALVNAAAKADGTTLGVMLTADAEMVGRLPSTPYDRDRIISAIVDATGKRYPLEDWAVLQTQAHESAPGRAQTMTLVRVNARDGGLNFSWWLIDWVKTGDTWKVRKLEPLAIQNMLKLQGAP